MNSGLVQEKVAEVRTAVNEGCWQSMRGCFESMCMEDCFRVVLAACDCSIAGQPGRIARLLFCTEYGDDQYHGDQEDYQDAMRMVAYWRKALLNSESGDGGQCQTVTTCIAELLETTQWKSIAVVAELAADSRHCRRLFERHLEWVKESGGYGVEC